MELVYHDMHIEYCNKKQDPRPGVIEINYCREGRCECAFGEQSYCYISAGAMEEMRKILGLLFVDLTRISEFSWKQDFYMVRANETGEGQLSIADIAARTRYTNPNKFSSAFRSEYRMPPTLYKKDV